MRAHALLVLAALVACHRAQVSERGRDAIVITAELPGASPTDIEANIATPIERAVSGVPNVVHVRSRTIAGSAIVSLELAAGADPFAAAEAARNEVASILAQMPRAMPPPAVTRAPGSVVLRYTVTSETLPLVAVTRANDDLVQALETIPGVGAVEVCGDQRARVVVEIGAEQLAATSLTLGDVVTALSSAHVALPAGGAYVVRGAQPLDRDGLAQTVVAQRAGAPIRVADVARVVDDADPIDCVAFDGGRRAIAIEVHAQSGADMIHLRDQLEQRLASSHPAALAVSLLPREKPLVFTIADRADQSLDARVANARTIVAIVGKLPEVSRAIVQVEAGRLRVIVVEANGKARAAVARALPDAYETDSLVVQLFGNDRGKLADAAHVLAKALAGDELATTRLAPRLEIDRTAAARYGVDAHEIADAFAAATTGLDVAGVRVHLSAASLDQALDTLLRTHTGISVPLRDLATLHVERQPSEIRHEDGRYWIGIRTRADAAAAREALAKLALPAGCEARLATGEP